VANFATVLSAMKNLVANTATLFAESNHKNQENPLARICNACAIHLHFRFSSVFETTSAKRQQPFSRQLETRNW
jgi:hypothetical protein